MDFKRYFGKIKNKNEKPKQKPETVDETQDNIAQEQESEITKQVDVSVKKTLNFVDGKKDPHEYIRRYLMESKYKDWFNRNYPNHTIYDAVGLSAADYVKMKRKLVPEPEQNIVAKQSSKLIKPDQKKSTNTKSDDDAKPSFNDFVDDRELISHNAFGDKEMKIKILEISDEVGQTAWKFGDRVKINKIVVTIKHLQTQQIEEGEFDIESIEKELAEKRHYTSTNRWVPTRDIKNGYVTNSRHTSLISDAAALDYITF